MRAIKLYTLLLINIVSFFGTNEEVTAREAIEINKKLKFLKNIVKNLPNTWKFTVLDAENNNFLIRVGNLWHRSRVKYQFFIDNQIYSRDYINSTQNIMYYAEFLTNGKAFQAATSSEQDRKNMQKDIISAADNVITDLNNAMDALGDKADNKERVKIYIKVRSDFARKLNEIVLENSKGGTFDSEKFFISGSFRDIYQLIPGPGFDTNKTFLYTLNRKPNKARARYYFSDAEIDQWRESESLQLPLPPDTDGTSILSWLVYKDNFYAVKKIIELGVDVNDIGYFGETALHWAAAFGRKDIYFYLLEKNADIDASYTGIDDKTILSPTAIAVIGGIWGILPNTELSGLSDDPYKTKEYLQENRKNTYYGDDECQVCLGKLMILQDLLEKKSKNINDELLFHALLRGNASMIKLIIDRAEEQNISLDYGEALAVAVGLQRDDAASLIWERGKFSKMRSKSLSNQLQEFLI